MGVVFASLSPKGRTMAVDFEQWLGALGLGGHAELLRAHDIDFRSIGHVTDADLRELGLSLGHRRRLLAAAEQLASGHAELAALRQAADPEQAERRPLTVLFCDIVGSTALARSLDPEDLREIFRRYQNAVTSAVIRYEGYVAKFMGDGIMAYFGWPKAFEDQAERAVRAGLDLVRAVEAIDLPDGRRLSTRVGIATGDVVIGDLVGDTLSDAEAVVGETPNLAFRLQELAGGGDVVIGPTTRQMVGTAFDLEGMGGHALKGFGDSVATWRVKGESGVETRFEAARGRAMTPIVGRSGELERLRDAWREAKTGRGQAVLLVGEAGIGKSRLIDAMRRSIGGDPRFGVRYQCSPYHVSSAFFPVIRQLQRIAGISPTDGNETRLDKLERVLEPTGNDVAAAPLFASLLGLDGRARFGALELSPQQLRQRTVETLSQHITALSRLQPVLLVLEDAHWLDPSTDAYLAELVEQLSAHRILVVVTCRPERLPNWRHAPAVRILSLDRLDDAAARRLVQGIAGDRLPPALIDNIVDRADGVPLFLEELTQSLIERETGDERVLQPEAIPTSLRASLIARLDRIASAKEIAQVGSVIGREFSFDLLHAVCGKTTSALRDSLDQLLDAGLIAKSGAGPNEAYAFRHALIQDAAYGTILLKRRRRLHRLIVDAVEAGAGDRQLDLLPLLAHHAERAGLWDKAFDYAHRAAMAAFESSALHEAIAHLRQTLAAIDRLPPTDDVLRQSIDIRFQLRNALWSVGANEAIFDQLDAAAATAEQLDDSRRLGWSAVFRSASLWHAGRNVEARQVGRAARALGDRVGDPSLQVAAGFYLGCTLAQAGKYRKSARTFERVLERVEASPPEERFGLPFVPAAVVRSWLVWSLAECGDFEAARAQAAIGVRVAEDANHPFSLAHILYDLGYLHIVEDDLAAAVRVLRRALAISREYGLGNLAHFVTGFLGYALAMSGDRESGIAMLERARARYQAIGSGLFHALVCVHLADARLAGGELDAAEAVLQQAFALTEERGERGHTAYAMRVAGELALARGTMAALEDARSRLTAALESANLRGMRPLAARCHRSLAEVCRRAGDRSGGESHAAAAIALNARSAPSTHEVLV